MPREKTWSLKRTVQCKKCPWKKSTNPHEIPRGYSVDRHKALERTIADTADPFDLKPNMACHEEHEAHCVGWLDNQLGRGNNIPLRMQMMSCANAGEIRTIGEQYESFADTLPKEDL